MRKLIKKPSIKNKRRKLLTLLFVINLFVKSPKLDYSTFNKVKNNNSLSLEIIHRPSRGGAVFEVDTFDMFKVINNKFKTPTDNKYNPFSLYLPPSPGVRERPPINLGTMSTAGFPLIKVQIKSQNDFLYRHLKVDPVFVNRKNPNPLKDCFPVPNVETLTGNFKDSTINLDTDFLTNLKNNPFQSKKLKDSAPQVLFVLSKLKELTATKTRNILVNTFTPDNYCSLVDCVKKKSMVKNNDGNDVSNRTHWNIDAEKIKLISEKYSQQLSKITSCQDQTELHEKLYNQELNTIAQEYRDELSNLFDSPQVDQLVKNFKVEEKFDQQKMMIKCLKKSMDEAAKTSSPKIIEHENMPTLVTDPKHSLGFKQFTYDLNGNNYSILVGKEISRRSTVDGLTTENLVFKRDFSYKGITSEYLFEIPFQQARDKFYHAKNFSVDTTPYMDDETFYSLQRIKIPRKKQQELARTVSMEAVNEFRIALKNHALDQDTKLIVGLHNLKRYTKFNQSQKDNKTFISEPTYHLVNNKTRNDCMYHLDKNKVGKFNSGWTLSPKQFTELEKTGNVD